MEEFFAAFDLFNELIGIAEAACNGYLKRQITGLDLKCLNTLKPAHAAFGNACYLLSGDCSENVADNSLRYAAGDAEYDAGAGVLGEGIVGLSVGKLGKVNAGLLYHPRKLLSGQHKVNKPLAVLYELGTRGLCLLRRAGHDSDRVQLIVGVMLPEDSAEHLHRRAAGGDLGHELGVHVFNVLYPAGAAGGEHGKLCAGLELFHELGRFLHDGEVSRQRGIENIICTEHLERGDYFAHNRLRGRKAEFLAYADANGRCDLDRDLLRWVVYRRPEL